MPINQRIWCVQNWHLGVWILDQEGLQVSMFLNGHGMDAETTLVKMSKPNNLEYFYFVLVGYTSVRNVIGFVLSCQLGLYGLRLDDILGLTCLVIFFTAAQIKYLLLEQVYNF